MSAAYREISGWLHSREEPVQFKDRFGAYGSILIALVMENGVHIEDFPVIQEYSLFFAAVCEKHGLTTAEVVSIISNLLSEDAEYIIRYERHGRFDKPGGIEQ